MAEAKLASGRAYPGVGAQRHTGTLATDLYMAINLSLNGNSKWT